MSEIYDPFAIETERTPGVSWKDAEEENIPVPATYVLKITESLQPPRQRRDMKGEPMTWSDGNPRMEVVVKGEAIQVPKGAERLDGKIVGFHAPIPSEAFRQIKAETTTKGNPIQPGGELTITLTARKKATPDAEYRSNFFEFSYKPGDPFAAGAGADKLSKSDAAGSEDDIPF